MKEKWLHSFEIEETQKVKETNIEKDESGEDIEVTREVEKTVPKKFKILKPTRKIQDDASIFYSVKVSEAIKMGLITKAYLIRKFQQDGVLPSEEEKNTHAENYSKAILTEVEIEKVTKNEEMSDEEKEIKLKNLNLEYEKLKDKIFEFESIQNSLFDNTAEKRASDLLNMWYLLNLLYFGEDDSESCVFGEGSFEEKVNVMNQIEDSGNELLSKAIEKAAFVLGQLNAGVNPEEIQ